MSDLNEMWAALESYQPHADKAGHGGSWKRMTTKRTEAAADAAWKAAPKGLAWAAAWAAGMAVSPFSQPGDEFAFWSAQAISKINEAISKEAMP